MNQTLTRVTSQIEALASELATISTEATGGGDTLIAGEGDNLVLAGVGADTVTAGGGVDLVLGDNGRITWTPGGVYSQFGTTDPTLGGSDDIHELDRRGGLDSLLVSA